MNLFSKKPTNDPDIAERVKMWVREVMGLTDDLVVMVTELRCAEEDCPDVETIIAVLDKPGKSRKHKLLKPISEVTLDDVRNLAARGTHG